MQTKLKLYYFAWLTCIIQGIRGTYEHMPSSGFNWLEYVVVGAIIWYISCIGKIKKYKWKIRCFILGPLYFLCTFIYNNNPAEFFYDFSPSILGLITIIGVYKSYSDSVSLHRKELVRRTEKFLHIINKFNVSENELKKRIQKDNVIDKTSIDYQLLFIEFEKAQKKLKQEILAGDIVSDFSYYEYYYEVKLWLVTQWKKSKGWRNKIYFLWKVIKHVFNPCLHYSSCIELKTAKTMAVYSVQFLKRNEIPFDENKLKNIQRVIDEIKAKYHKGKKIPRYNSIFGRSSSSNEEKIVQRVQIPEKA